MGDPQQGDALEAAAREPSLKEAIEDVRKIIGPFPEGAYDALLEMRREDPAVPTADEEGGDS